MIPRSPPMRVRSCTPSKREPGIVYFTTRPGGLPVRQPYGWLIGIDRNGEVSLNRRFEGTSQDVRVQPDGNILFSQSAQGLLHEVDSAGRTQRIWHARGKFAETKPPDGSIELPADYMHHTVNVLPNGNLLILDAEAREFDNWPTSHTDASAPRATATLVGDVIREVTRDGRLVHSHRLFDILDPWRVTHGSMDNYWHKQGFPGAHDWSHANSASYDASDDTLLVSVRHQDCIVKIGRGDGKLRWILGNPAGWRDPWRQYLLTPQAATRWQFHQHDCSAPAPNRVMCFDNGNWRAPAFETPLEDGQNFSRAVEFEIDAKAKTVRQVWEYGEHAKERIFACYQGGALRLPQTGNTFITFGGMCFRDGKPYGSNADAFGRARLIEVTPSGEVVFDLEIDDSGSPEPMAYSAFRSDHAPG